MITSQQGGRKTNQHPQTVAEANIMAGVRLGILSQRVGEGYRYGGWGIPPVHKREVVHTSTQRSSATSAKQCQVEHGIGVSPKYLKTITQNETQH